VGLMTLHGDDFAYWIGLFFPAKTPIPTNLSDLEFLDLPTSKVGVSWIYGNGETGEIFGELPHATAYEKLQTSGFGELDAGGADTVVFFERYNGERFGKADELGNVILDYGFYLK